MKRLLLFFTCLIACTIGFAQGFSDLIGKEETSETFKTFVSTYSLEQSNAVRYQSKNGIEVVLKNGKVSEIHLHRASSVFGSYSGELPSKLFFGMNSSEVKAILGKPTTAYTTSGYNEYEYSDYILSCWFEDGVLSQVVVSSKQ